MRRSESKVVSPDPTIVKRLAGYFRVAVWVVLCWQPAHLCAAPAALARERPTYRLDQLAVQLGDSPQALRADLARIVLSEMAAGYAAEAAHARREIQHGSTDRDLRRWAAAVEGLAHELAASAETVTDTTPVRATLDRDNSVTLLVDGQPVTVTGPRIDNQADLEWRIMQRFCDLHPCDTLIEQFAETAPPAPAAKHAPHWSFGAQTGPRCTSDGLEFRFRNTDDLRRKREACSRVVGELYTLIAEIQRYKANGPLLDWNALAIHTLPARDRQQVELSKGGDSIQAYLPALAAEPDLLTLVRPWLVAKVNGLAPPQIVIDAETLLPPLGFLGQ
jgi:hypothetical protein